MIGAAEFAGQVKAKRSGQGWIARCPAHDDRTASLSIGAGEDGTLLLKCHAGCSFQAILDAAGIEHATPNGLDHDERPRIAATYDYRDSAGKLAFQVVRFYPKSFRQRAPDGTWSIRGIERVPYRLPDVLDASEVYIVEGEKDADQLAALGVAATCNPGGAGKWLNSFGRWFDGRHVTILPDNDQPGRDHAADVATKLLPVAASVKIVELPGLPDKGDVSDWIARGGTAAELLQMADGEPRWHPKVDAKPNGQAEGPLLVSAKAFTDGYQAPEYLIDGLLQRGRIYSVTAPTGHGKTAVSLCLDAHLAAGRELAGRRVGQGNIVYFAAENPDDVKARVLLMADRFGLDLGTLPLWFVEGGFNIDDWTDHIRGQVEAIGGALSITIDTGPAFQAACGFTDENDNMQALRFALKLRDLTKMPGGPAVLVPTHPIKNAARDNLLPRGGSSFLNEMDGNFTLWSEGDRETTELHWAGKLRGPTFDPVTFALEKGTCPALVDSAGRQIPSVWAYQACAQRAERAASRQREDEDAVLIVMLEAPDHTLATWAEALGWRSPTTGEPLKPRVYRTLERLKAEKLATQKRGRWLLTPAGKKEAERLKEQAQDA